VVILYGTPPMSLREMWDFGFALPPCIPSFMRDVADSDRVSFTGFQTLGAVAVASYLRNHGVDIEAQDFYVDQVNLSKARIVGISSTFMDLGDVKEIVNYVKEQNPKAIVVLGGPLSWSYPPSRIMNEIPDLDIMVLKEGEKTFLDLVTRIQSGNSRRQVHSIIYRSEGGLMETPPRPLMDPSEFPRPDWNLVDLSRRMKILPIETSRGCLYDCVFCSETHYWPKPVRFKAIEKVIEEIKIDVDEFGVRTLRFVDSCFTAPERRCAKICDAICKEDLDIRWTSYARIDNMSRDLVKKMKRSGCVAVDIGMESGDLGILRSMGKMYTPGHIEKAIHTAKEVDIITHCNLVVGFPGETRETIDNTISVLERAQPDTYSSYLLDVAPHTLIHDNPERFGIQGERLTWRHKTMETKQAMMEIQRIYATVSSSHPFLGGEYFACSLASLGYSTRDIRDFFSTFHDLYKNPNVKTTEIFQKASRDLKQFIVPWRGTGTGRRG